MGVEAGSDAASCSASGGESIEPINTRCNEDDEIDDIAMSRSPVPFYSEDSDMRRHKMLSPIVEVANSATADDLPQDELDKLSDGILQQNRDLFKNSYKAKLKRVNANADFELRQLNQQIQMTDQLNEQISMMRLEQTKLEEKLRLEKREIAQRNKALVQELADIEASKELISVRERDLSLLKEQFNEQLSMMIEAKETLIDTMKDVKDGIDIEIDASCSPRNVTCIVPDIQKRANTNIPNVVEFSKSNFASAMQASE